MSSTRSLSLSPLRTLTAVLALSVCTVIALPASAGSGMTGHGDQTASAMPAKMDIVETAIGAGQFTTLVAAVKAAGLVDTLKGEGPFTVFAPTDAAFAKLGAGTIDDLLKSENRDKLTAILTYHVVPGAVMSADLAGKTLDAKTVQGGTLAIDATNGVMVDGTRVIQADVAASNGVIHVIDGVLMPAS